MIVHFTTVHPRNDVRIFYKEIRSLNKKDTTVLLVSDGKPSEIVDGVRIINTGIKYKSRLKRFIFNSYRILRKSLNLDADIYHFHDPELILVGLFLKGFGKKVVYDVHEDLPRQIGGKPYLKEWIKPKLSRFIEIIENFAAKRFNYIITATPFIRDRFLKINQNCIDINNYPIHNQIKLGLDYSNKNDEICYIGGISENRGVFELIESLQYSKVRLNLAGNFENESFQNKCQKSLGWKYVNFYGYIDRAGIKNILNNSKIGIVTLHPIINYLDSLPVKMFEYLSAGLPIIASDFPLWKRIIAENDCGLCVNPKSSLEIADAVNFLFDNPKLAQRMGEKGREEIIKKYNWELEEKKLYQIYSDLLKK